MQKYWQTEHLIKKHGILETIWYKDFQESVLTHTYNPSTWGVEAEEFRVDTQPGLHNETQTDFYLGTG